MSAIHKTTIENEIFKQRHLPQPHYMFVTEATETFLNELLNQNFETRSYSEQFLVADLAEPAFQNAFCNLLDATSETYNEFLANPTEMHPFIKDKQAYKTAWKQLHNLPYVYNKRKLKLAEEMFKSFANKTVANATALQITLYSYAEGLRAALNEKQIDATIKSSAEPTQYASLILTEIRLARSCAIWQNQELFQSCHINPLSMSIHFNTSADMLYAKYLSSISGRKEHDPQNKTRICGLARAYVAAIINTVSTDALNDIYRQTAQVNKIQIQTEQIVPLIEKHQTHQLTQKEIQAMIDYINYDTVLYFTNNYRNVPSIFDTYWDTLIEAYLYGKDFAQTQQ